MVDDYTKLLITSYIDGELTPREVAELKQVLEWSAETRDYLQGHLLVVQRLRQALNSPKTSVSGKSRPIMAQLLLQAAAKERQAKKYGYWPAAALAVAASLVLWVGISWWIDLGAHPELVADQGRGGQRIENEKEGIRIDDPNPKTPGPLAQSPTVGETQGVQKKHTDAVKPIEDTRVVKAANPAPEPGVAVEKTAPQVASSDNPSEQEGDGLFGAPLGPTLSLKKVDLLLPQVVKLRDLDAAHLTPAEEKAGEILRLDLPTYQESEGLKRIIKTLQAEGCKTLFDPGTEERMKKNLPVGPVILTIHGLDPAKLCLALQNTSKVVSGKPGPNQPPSVFDEAIIGTLHPKEAELLGLISSTTSAKGFPAGSAATGVTKKGTRPNLSQEPIALIQSASLLKMLNSPIKNRPAMVSMAGKPPVVVQIFPLK